MKIRPFWTSLVLFSLLAAIVAIPVYAQEPSRSQQPSTSSPPPSSGSPASTPSERPSTQSTPQSTPPPAPTETPSYSSQSPNSPPSTNPTTDNAAYNRGGSFGWFSLIIAFIFGGIVGFAIRGGGTETPVRRQDRAA